MFLGHFGLGFAGKKVDRRPSLGTYFLAAQFIDLLWPFFLLAGIEQVEVEVGNTAFTPLNFISYPYSHGLLAVLVWSVLFGLVYFLIKKYRRPAIFLAVLVLSHWFLDFITHRPDLPLSSFTEEKYGLALWNNTSATILLELVVFATGIYLYITATEPRNRTGKYALWGFVVFMLLIYFMNAFGPPPSSADAIGFVGLSQWILIGWGYWIDNNRKNVAVPESKFLLHQIE